MAISAVTVTDLDPGQPLAFPGNQFPYQAAGDFPPCAMKLVRITLTGTYETSADAFAVTAADLGGVTCAAVIHGPLVAANESEAINVDAEPTLGGIVFTLGYSAGSATAFGDPGSADTLDDYYVDCIVIGTPSTYANG